MLTLATACGNVAPPEPGPDGQAGATLTLADVPGIVDPDNRDWPRTVEASGEQVTVEQQPERVATTSVGLDEVTLQLLPRDRIAGTGKSTQDPAYSNVAALAEGLPVIGRDPEQIVARQPDLVVAVLGPFVDEDQLRAVEAAGVTLVRLDQGRSLQDRIREIVLLGYLYGEEERALTVANQVQDRYLALTGAIPEVPEDRRPKVLAVSGFDDDLTAAGSGSTQDGIIQAAGGTNAAAGIEGTQTVDPEGIIAMEPDVIIITAPPDDGEATRERLLDEAALAAVPAVANGEIHVIPAVYSFTLSYWNLRGAEELATLLWPDQLGDLDLPPLATPTP